MGGKSVAVIRRSRSSERRLLVHLGSVIVVLLFLVCASSVACRNAVAAAQEGGYANTVSSGVSPLAVPATNGNLLFKDVSTWNADVPWTEVVSGMEMMIQGRYHNVTMLVATKDPLTVRVVLDSSFQGVMGLRVDSPDIGLVTDIIEYNDMHARFVGTGTLLGEGIQVPLDGVSSMRTVGTITLTVGGLSQSVDVNLLVLVGFSDGQVVWTRLGVPMGWPFQLLPS